MKKHTGIFAMAFIVMALIFGAVTEAQAKRLGGGKSFGSRQSYSTPYQRPASPPPSSQPAQPAQQPAAQPDYRPNPAPQSSMGRGLMGMLGGLAIGGLLGSLLGGSAFHGFGLMDGLLLLLVGFGLYKLFASRRPQPATGYARQNHAQEDYNAVPDYSPTAPANSSAGFDTDLLFGKNKTAASSATPMATNLNKPADFDEQQFLTLAEQNYRTLQAAWDKRDLADIRGLTTDKVFAELQEQLRASNETNQTDILKVNAELLELREIGNEQEAVVMFDNILREDRYAQAQQVREVWHFIRPKNGLHANWLLDGIQQLED